MDNRDNTIKICDSRIILYDGLLIRKIDIRALTPASLEISFWIAAAQFTQVIPLKGIMILLLSILIYYHISMAA